MRDTRSGTGKRRKKTLEAAFYEHAACVLGLAAVGVALAMVAARVAFSLTSQTLDGARGLYLFLFDVSLADPTTYFGVGALMIAVTTLTSWVPALRATRVDPNAALASAGGVGVTRTATRPRMSWDSRYERPWVCEIGPASLNPMDRSKMTARMVPLESDEAGDPRMGGTVDERVAAVAELTAAAWRLSGRRLPSYTRKTMPVAVGTLRDQVDGT